MNYTQDGANGVWRQELSEWTDTESGTEPGWTPRFGHTTVVEAPNAANAQITRMCVVARGRERRED